MIIAAVDSGAKTMKCCWEPPAASGSGQWNRAWVEWEHLVGFETGGFSKSKKNIVSLKVIIEVILAHGWQYNFNLKFLVTGKKISSAIWILY